MSRGVSTLPWGSDHVVTDECSDLVSKPRDQETEEGSGGGLKSFGQNSGDPVLQLRLPVFDETSGL